MVSGRALAYLKLEANVWLRIGLLMFSLAHIAPKHLVWEKVNCFTWVKASQLLILKRENLDSLSLLISLSLNKSNFS